jgi:diguanylate cyclase (GGDEF)-like protein
MADKTADARRSLVLSGSSGLLGMVRAGLAQAADWHRSLLSKIILAFLGVALLSYGLGALVGWSMFVDSAKAQWHNQARINTQIASSTLRNVYTYVVIETDTGGQVQRLVTAQPVGDDDSILFTGFTPTDVLALVAAQTKNEAWLFRFDKLTDRFVEVAASSGTAPSETTWEDQDRDPFFGDALPDTVLSGFATLAGERHFVGMLPIVSPDDQMLGAVVVSIGKATVLNQAKEELLRNALAMVFTVLLLTGLFVTVFARRLFQPVPTLVQATLQIAGEVTDTATPFQNRNDEIGDMARAIEALREAVVERARLREIRDMAVKLEHMAHHDALTGLGNRALLMKTLGESLEDIEHGGAFNVLMLDLDRFKVINDTLGHGCGDQLLVTIATRISDLLGEGDLAARLGGDEFAIVQRVRSDGMREARELASRLLQVISSGVTLEGQEVAVGTSIGISRAPSDGLSASHLLQNADLALYRAKAAGRGTLVVFEQGMDMVVQDQHALEIDLRHALQRGEFELHYQPFINISTGLVCGFEALVRWRHPHQGLIPPDRFIPLAEETGIIVPLGAWVLERASADAVSWPADMRLAVNLSPVQLRHCDIVDTIDRALKASGLPAARLELEVTETAMLAGAESRRALEQVNAMGIAVVLDDFGTGYASLSYLADIPFSKIKIDRTFVSDLPTHSTSRAIVAAITNLARELGMEVTAEGVETKEQLVILMAAGCTHAQGYYFARPRPLAELELQAQTKRPRATQM